MTLPYPLTDNWIDMAWWDKQIKNKALQPGMKPPEKNGSCQHCHVEDAVDHCYAHFQPPNHHCQYCKVLHVNSCTGPWA